MSGVSSLAFSQLWLAASGPAGMIYVHGQPQQASASTCCPHQLARGLVPHGGVARVRGERGAQRGRLVAERRLAALARRARALQLRDLQVHGVPGLG